MYLADCSTIQAGRPTVLTQREHDMDGMHKRSTAVEFGGVECALVSFLYTNGSLDVHTRCTLAGWLDVLLCELDNQLHRL